MLTFTSIAAKSWYQCKSLLRKFKTKLLTTVRKRIIIEYFH